MSKEAIGECILSREDLGWSDSAYCHKFEPRYDEDMPKGITSLADEMLRMGCVGDVLKLKKRTYVCDVCMKCGAVVRREE